MSIAASAAVLKDVRLDAKDIAAAREENDELPEFIQ